MQDMMAFRLCGNQKNSLLQYSKCVCKQETEEISKEAWEHCLTIRIFLKEQRPECFKERVAFHKIGVDSLFDDVNDHQYLIVPKLNLEKL